MTDRDAFLAAIAASPDDDLPRLVFADWCEERGVDRELATAEFVRLTCGRPVPKRAKTRKCSVCRGSKLREATRDDSHWLEPCTICNVTGREPNPPGDQMYPKVAHEWLVANWRRLVPALMRWWDHERVKTATQQAIQVEATPPAVWAALAEVRAAVRDGELLPFATFPRRGSVRAGVPFVLPVSRYAPDQGERIYTATVNLSFARGFATDASWRAPVLGEKIAAALAEDQPLAAQSGPHARVDAAATVTA